MGDTTITDGATAVTYGALGAEDGHPTQFAINFVEIGNEDWCSATYPGRFPVLYSGIRAASWNINPIYTAYNENNDYNISILAGDLWNTHHLEEQSYFLDAPDYFDNWQEEINSTDGTIFIRKYSVFQVGTPSGTVNFSNPIGEHIFFPSHLAAIGEEVYLTSAKRNPNIVKFSLYAPSFGSLYWINWTPDLVTLTTRYDETVLSASFYAQQLFAHHHKIETLPETTTQGIFDPL